GNSFKEILRNHKINILKLLTDSSNQSTTHAKLKQQLIFLKRGTIACWNEENEYIFKDTI
ncbi:hypothetical protein CEXT_412851, partial [Caerostris extrusa]